MNRLDQNIINTLRDIMEDEFSSLIDVFLMDARRHLALIKDAITHKERDVIAASAHAIKGSASNLGAVDLSLVSSELERQVKFEQPEFSALEKLVDQLSSEFHELVPELMKVKSV